MQPIQAVLVSVLITIFSPAISRAQNDSIDIDTYELQEIYVKSQGTRKLNFGASNSELITSVELTRAACCSLGESFTTNPSVDVNYSDAATGAKQIRLLGLSGKYIQMLTENVPNFRGVSSPFALDFIPGPWIQSIQISKGASSVKNGYESITGQINVEMKKPQTERALNLNAYFDSDGKIEFNASGNLHLGKKWSGGILLHGSNSFWTHDADDDGFVDMPKIKRLALTNRWAYFGDRHIFQISAKGLLERRQSGQIGHHSSNLENPYVIDIYSKRLELFAKNAFMLDSESDANIALIIAGSVHDIASTYGLKSYDALQYDAYLSLMFERTWADLHSLSTGLNYQYDDYRQHYLLEPIINIPATRDYSHEGVAGAYGQYTLNLDGKFVAMAGLRYDFSSLYGSFLTPRIHLRFNPKEDWSFHASAGLGRRSPHPMAEFSYLLASSRTFVLPEKLRMESGANTGGGFTWSHTIGEGKLSLSGEYYYTNFFHQLTADLNTPHQVIVSTDSRGYSHNVQVEVSIDPIDDLSVSGAYRFTDIKVDYGNGYIIQPLTSRHRGLFSVAYAPMMGIWQFDATLSINGGGRMPDPYRLSDGSWSWNATFPTYCRLNLQATRNFRHWSIYLGGENLTNYRQINPIISASDPWGSNFDATMVWGPLSGAMVYIGVRINL